jgi:hypothetical protein
MSAQSDIWISEHIPVRDGRGRRKSILTSKRLVFAQEILEKPAGEHQVVYLFRGAGKSGSWGTKIWTGDRTCVNMYFRLLGRYGMLVLLRAKSISERVKLVAQPR